ncbi:MAG TPA: hypothetical protein VL309_09880 [Vicinamibacterales bacterium]|jgi:uncharacterized protein involved in exopolysaccharide biosynthesis|nr:hypothetical protein [Vicinamibacterales bacterium]
MRPLSHRRRSTVRAHRTIAADAAPPKSLELETRIARVESALGDLSRTLEVVLKRTTALQAQLDHLEARAGRT